jgi:hypothetical protein
MKQSALDSMSIDELFMLHERIAATLSAKITAEKEALKDRLNDFGPTGRELMKLSDNQIGDRLHAALEAVGTDEGETIRGNTALVAARQTLGLLKLGLLIAAERDSDYVSTIINQPVVPPSKT